MDTTDETGTGADRFAAMIEALDTRIFTLPSQTSESDRRSLLRLQLFVRTRDPAYRYLETGSHLGGSLLPHLADPRCAAAVSIDPRPASQPDARGRSFDYEGNSTGRMLGLLREHLGAQPLGKLRTFDLDAVEVTPDMIEGRIRLALIDGEHTVIAAFSDFISILPLLAPDAVLAWHDANLVVEAIRSAERVLAWQGVPFRTLFLPENVAAMGLGAMAEPLAAELGPEALSRETYLAMARDFVERAVAVEVLRRGGLGTRATLELTARRLLRPLWHRLRGRA
jgi:hypothetical protein